MGSLEVSPAADVLVYEVVDESARTRAQLHYFLVDGTAAVFGGEQMAMCCSGSQNRVNPSAGSNVTRPCIDAQGRPCPSSAKNP